MSSTARVRIAVPFRASVVPRGARLPREIVYAADAAADIRVAAAEDVPLAIRVDLPEGARQRRSRVDYFGHDGDLWLPVHIRNMGDSCLTPDRAMRSMAGGTSHFGNDANPFLAVGCREVAAEAFAGATAIEDALLRTIQADDRAACTARAARVARDILFTEDGRVFRRSPGPFLCMGAQGPFVVATRFDPPPSYTAHALFAPGRLQEAVEFGLRTLPLRVMPAAGDDLGMEILQEGFVRDRDPLYVARAIAPQKLGCTFGLAAVGLDGEGKAEAARAIAAVAELHGIDSADLPRKYYDREVQPAGVAVPSIERIVEAVGLIRRFDLDHARRRIHGDAVENNPAILRWDEFEAPRLGLDVPAPDLSPLVPSLEGLAP